MTDEDVQIVTNHESALQRVAILGLAGAGKSTLAARLAARTGLPVVHLDSMFWRPGWEPAPREESAAAFASAISAERWILDGNFLGGQSGDELARFAFADTVIFLDLPRPLCMWSVLERWLRDRRRRRPDLPPGCDEQLDLDLLRWIWSYPRTDRPRVLALLDRIGRSTRVHHFRSRAEVRSYVASL